MALELVTGSSGSGKSYRLYQELIQKAIAHPEQDFIVMVPDQFTMQTQKDLVLMHPNHGLLNIDVLSFNRLAYRIFEEVGGNTEPILEEIGKSLILRRVLAEHAGELKLLSAAQAGAVDQIKSLISELLQYRVKPQDVKTWIEDIKGESLLSVKLRDIQVVYEGFLEYLNERYLTTEEVPERLCRVIESSKLIRGSTVLLDGFTGFTPVQHLVIEKLLSLCSLVQVAVTCDAGEDLLRRNAPQALFHMSHVMAAELCQLAKKTGCEVLPVRTVFPGEQSRFSASSELHFLEQSIFRYRKKEWAKEVSDIRLLQAKDPDEEILYVTGEIRRLIREEKLRYRDIAVICGDLEEYGRRIEKHFEQEELPHFIDRKRSLMENPLASFLCTALEMLIRGFSYESVFSFLRTSLTDFSPEEIDRMENYVLAVGIRGWNAYENTWTRTARSIDPGELVALNQLRERFAELLRDFTEAFRKRGTTIREKTEAFYLFLVKNRIQEKLQAYERLFQDTREFSLAKEFSQAYGVVMHLFDKLVEMLGSERAGIRLYRQILEAGLLECSIGLIPPGEDQIMVGDIERTRLKNIKVLFLVGANDGMIPKKKEDCGILNEKDRESLKENTILLAPDAKTELYEQRFYLYLALTKPSRRLYLSWSKLSGEGEALLPSYLSGSIRKLFPRLPVAEAGEHSLEFQIETNEGRKQLLRTGIQHLPEEPLSDALLEIAGYAEKAFAGSLIQAACARNPEKELLRDTAKALYGISLSSSVTKLENFAACAFRHFAGYGLRLEEREKFEFRAADFGTILHGALERFTRYLQKEAESWEHLPDSRREELTEKALLDVTGDYGNSILQSSNRNRSMIDRMQRILSKTIWALQQQILDGDFRPYGAEIRFSGEHAYPLMLRDGSCVRFSGQIDRLDLFETQDQRFLRVIDYKTGSKQFDMTQLYYGLQLQLVLYLNAALRQMKDGLKQTEAAGVYYYLIQDPVLDWKRLPASREDVAHELPHAQKKELRLIGLSRAESEILEHLDRSFSDGKKESEVVRVRLKNDGTFYKDAQTESKAAFDLILQYADYKMRALSESILDGTINAEPVSNEGKTPCEYCIYRSVCGFDEQIPGYAVRHLQKRERSEILQRMEEDLKEAEQGGEAWRK